MPNSAPTGAQKIPLRAAKVASIAHAIDHHLRAVDDDRDLLTREGRERGGCPRPATQIVTPRNASRRGVEVDIERHPTRSRSSELEGLEAAMPPMPHCTQLVNLRWLAALISLAKGSMISMDGV